VRRHAANQIAAERLAEQVGSFSFSHAPKRTVAVTEGILAAVFRKALDAGLIIVPVRAQGHHHEYVGGKCIHCPKRDTGPSAYTAASDDHRAADGEADA
jgi:hypothetical protein